MKIVERTLLVLLLIGVLFKFLLWKGADIMLLVSLCSLSLCYFPFGFYLLSGKTDWKASRGHAAIGGLCLWLLPQAVLFKLLNWVGGPTISVIGIVGAAIGAFYFYQLKRVAGHDPIVVRQMLIRLIAWALPVLVLLPMSPVDLARMQHFRDPEHKRLRLEYLQDRKNPEKLRALREYEEQHHKQRY